MSVLFSIYHPYSNHSFKSICGLLCFDIPLYPKEPIDNKDTYNVYIQNNVIYTHVPNKITGFFKNQIEYKIYSDDYSKHTPILHVSIYDDNIQIKLTKTYEFSYTKNDKMDYILRILQDSYNEYISSIKPFTKVF
jgi:hypothetical protein